MDKALLPSVLVSSVLTEEDARCLEAQERK